MKTNKTIRLTLSADGELWLHVRSPSGKSAGLNLTDVVEGSISKEAILETATKVRRKKLP